MIYDFEERLSWSEGVSDASDYENFYRLHFPDLVQAVSVRSGNHIYQRSGVDRILLLGNGKQLTVDEKVRDKDWGDFLCETWSVWREGQPGNKRGWTLDPAKTCDLIAWIIRPSGKACLLPYVLLRAACVANEERWFSLGRERVARNRDYITRNLVVPWDELWACMRRAASCGVAKVGDPENLQLALFGKGAA